MSLGSSETRSVLTPTVSVPPRFSAAPSAGSPNGQAAGSAAPAAAPAVSANNRRRVRPPFSLSAFGIVSLRSVDTIVPGISAVGS